MLPADGASQLRMPALVAFDLDFTLWDLWVDVCKFARAVAAHADGANRRTSLRR